MTKSRPSPFDEDRNAFRRAMADVRPLQSQTDLPAQPQPRPKATVARAARRDMLREGPPTATHTAALEVHDDMAFRRPQLRDDVWRRLQRGKFAVEAEIDLHGLRTHAAQDALRQFLDDSVREGLRCVRVIHGKGLRSGAGGPVLKHAVSLWLRSVENVAACASARPAHGGSGAVYVLLTVRK
jgi:DNA-nicking Smr family endonuclease